MSDDEMRVAILKRLGWRYAPIPTWKTRMIGPGKRIRTAPPNPLKSLDTLHEAEKGMTKEQIALYREYFHSDENYGIFFTARERCEILCRVFWPERFNH